MKRFLLCLFSLMLLMVGPSAAKVHDNNVEWILPWGSDTQWQMKYFFKDHIDDIDPPQDSNGNPWYAVNYDDSSWEILTGPMGSEVYDFSGNRGYECTVEFSSYYLRRSFVLSDISDDDYYYFQVFVDDIAIVYINGVKVMKGDYDGNDSSENISLIPKNLLKKGENTLAVYIDDNIGNDFGFDYSLFTCKYPIDAITYTDDQGVIYELNFETGNYTVTGHTDDFNVNIEIPATLFGYKVTTIGEYSFCWSELESVVLPEGIEIFEENSLSDCNLSSIVIPASVTSLYPNDDNPFSANPKLVSIQVKEGNTVYDSRNNCNAIIETANNRLVAGCATTIIPENVTSIGNDAFLGSQFSKIVLPKDITSIGNIAFISCDKLKTIVAQMAVPASLDDEAFEDYHYSNVILYVPKGCKTAYQQADVWRNFQTIVEMDGDDIGGGDIIMIDDSTFSALTFEGVRMVFKILDPVAKTVQVGNDTVSIDRSTAGTVTIPTFVNGYTVVGIGRSGFHSCAELTTVWLPDSLQFIGDYAFYGCTKLRTIQIPETVYGISENAFTGCSELTDVSCPYIPGVNLGVVFPNANVEIIGYKASDEDYDVVIPRLVTSIGQRTFSHCQNIRTMRVEEGNSVYDSRDNCNAIILTAENKLLYGCKNTSIPETITAIGEYAFEGHTGLVAIAIPAAVAAIGEGAFTGCTGLTSVTSRIATPYAIDDSVFSAQTYQTATLYVPEGTKQLYLQTNGWKNFVNIVERDETYSIVAYKKDGLQTNYSGIGTFSVPDDAVAVVIMGSTSNITVLPNDNPNTLYYINSNESVPSGVSNNVVIGDVADNITLVEGYDFFVPLLFTANTISYSMTPTKGSSRGTIRGWETIVLPFDVERVTTNNGEIDWFHSNDDESKNFWVRSFSDTSVEDLERIIYENVQDFKANTPYIIAVPDNHWGEKWNLVGKQMVFHGSNATLMPNVDKSIERGVYKITGTTTSMTLNNVWVMNDEGSSFVEKEKAEVKPFHAYIIKRTNIDFADAEVKRICVENWDTNGDGELSFAEAAAVMELGTAFMNNVTIKTFEELRFFKGLTSISDNAFYNCKSMTSINLPDNVSIIGNTAFRNCINLTSIAIPNSVATIGGSVFAGCTALTSIEIPYNVTSIGEYNQEIEGETNVEIIPVSA
ncbi:MAG: leucine-rich repeat domain-containing protein [Prevotella sp.]|nr:leucine-rich repeat domain-containing protein [Prevotella sp.]